MKRTLGHLVLPAAAPLLLLACAGDDPLGPPVTCTALPSEFTEPAQALQGADAEQVVEGGVRLRRSTLRLSFAGAAVLCDAAGLAVETAVVDPVSGEAGLRPLPVMGASVEGGALIVVVEGPVSEGSRLSVADGAVIAGEAALGGSGTLSGTLLSPAEAALWFKAYEPTEIDLFPAASYPGASAPVQLPIRSEAEIRAELDAHLGRVVTAGRIDEARRGELLALFDDPAVRENFRDDDGTFQPFLLAATLATAGTSGESTIDALIGGVNATGQPARVRFFDTGGPEASVDVIDGRMIVSVHPRQHAEAIQHLAPLLVHEALHQDNTVGQDEEVVAFMMQPLVHGELVLIDPTVATTGTRLGEGLNLQLLWLLNSGQLGFPWPGFLTAPLLQDPPNIMPRSQLVRRSFEQVLRADAYAAVPVMDAPGNEHLDLVASRITGATQQGLAFDEATVRLLDDVRAFSSEEVFRLLEILRLELAGEPALADRAPSAAVLPGGATAALGIDTAW